MTKVHFFLKKVHFFLKKTHPPLKAGYGPENHVIYLIWSNLIIHTGVFSIKGRREPLTLARFVLGGGRSRNVCIDDQIFMIGSSTSARELSDWLLPQASRSEPNLLIDKYKDARAAPVSPKIMQN